MLKRKKVKIYIDFETQSDVPLDRRGVFEYTHDKSFRAYLLCYSIGGKKVSVIREPAPGEVPAEIKKAMKLNYEFVAHNAEFDSEVFNAFFNTNIPYEKWNDTAARCRAVGVPGSLDAASKFFGLGEKDASGKESLKKYFKRVEIEKDDWPLLLRYGKQDVNLLIKLDKLIPEVDEVNDFIRLLIHSQNEKGILIDRARLKTLFNFKEKLKVEIIKEAQKFGLYGKKSDKLVCASADQIKKLFASELKIDLTSIAEKELEDFLQFEKIKLPKKANEILSLFREIQSKSVLKIDNLNDTTLPRITGFQLFHGAHTGRPAGRGIQLLNVARLPKRLEPLNFEKALEEIKKFPLGEQMNACGSMVWSILRPDPDEIIVRSDLSAIEPRVGAWLRSDKKVLDLYRKADSGEGKDEYTIFGDSMDFPDDISRALSKIVILAACYGMSSDRLRAQCRQYAMPDPGEKEAKRILDTYHRSNPSVKNTWFSMVNTAVQAIITKTDFFGFGLVFAYEKIGGVNFLRLDLPSGRKKYYAGVEVIAVGSKGWKSFSYQSVKGFRVDMRPAMFYENIVQTVAADVLFYKAFLIEKEKVGRVALTIYDETINSVKKKNLDKVKKIMNDDCPLLPGMPVQAKFEILESFHKGDRVK